MKVLSKYDLDLCLLHQTKLFGKITRKVSLISLCQTKGSNLPALQEPLKLLNQN